MSHCLKNGERGMMKRVLILGVATMLGLCSANANAGYHSPTAHSRANCFGNNESVTWHAYHSYWWRVESHHFPEGWGRPLHIVNTGQQFTWRAAAIHTLEAFSSRGDKWWVSGYHFYYPAGKERLDVLTGVGDCSIYDGWWDT